MHHAIQRILFDVEIEERARAEEIQNRISDHYRRRLESVIEACLTEAASADTVHIFDRIELDLGPISEARMEAEMEDKIRTALRKALSDKLNAPGWVTTPGEGAVSIDQNRLRLLESFLRRGFFPWFAGMQAPNPDTLLEEIIKALPRDLERMIRRLGQKAPVRRRLAFQFVEPSIHRVVRLLEQTHADLILTYARDVQRVHEDKPVVPEPARTFRRVRWELILTYLLVERGSYFNTRSFIKSFLQQMARRYRIAYLDLLTGLTARVHALDLPFSTRYSLPAMLRSLQEEEQTGLLAVPDTARYADLDLLAFYLLRGAVPAWSSPADATDIEALFQRLMVEDPEAVVTLVQTLGQRAAVRRRLARQFAEPTLRRLVEVLEPQEAPFILRYTEELRATHQKERVVEQDAAGFRQATWEFVLTYLLVERGSVFNARMFVRSILRQIAARFNVAYETVLAFLAEKVHDVPTSTTRFQRLITIIERLQSEEDDEVGAPEEAALLSAQDEVAEPVDEAAALEHYVRYGIVPEALLPLTAKKLAHWLRSLPDTLLLAVLHRVGPKQHALERILTSFPDKVFERLLHLLAPGEAAPILAYAASVRLARKRGRVIAEPAAVFRTHLRVYVLAYVLQTQGPVSLTDLAEATLRAVATRYDLRYGQVLAAWGAKLTAPALLTVFQTLRVQEEAAREAVPSAVPIIKPTYAETYTEADLIFYYLQQGAIPAWATVPTRGMLRSVLLRLLESQPKTLLSAWLPTMARSAAFRRRLLSLVPEPARKRLIAAIHPQFALLSSAREELDALHAQRRLVPEDRQSFRHVSWDILLAFAADRHAARIDAAGFAAYVLQALAVRHGIPSPTLAQRLVEQIRERKTGILMDAAGMLEDNIAPTVEPSEPAPAEPALWDELTASGRIDLLVYVLRYGAIPWWGRLLAQRPPEAWFLDLLTDHADQLIPALKQTVQQPQGIARLMRLMPPSALSRLIEALVPEYSGFVMTFLLAGEHLEKDERLSPTARAGRSPDALGCSAGLAAGATYPGFSGGNFCSPDEPPRSPAPRPFL